MKSLILKEKPVNAGVTRVHYSGEPHICLDIAFIAEGYTTDEMEKFRGDVKKMADILFSEAPFDQYRDKINIWAVEAVSEESGTDVPGRDSCSYSPFAKIRERYGSLRGRGLLRKGDLSARDGVPDEKQRPERVLYRLSGRINRYAGFLHERVAA
ncbi:MAG: M64 family metallopeptidase [Bacteroidales bacterium]|nr:M64 family metallopeptidase [Bacteroidales bacterium]